MKNRMRLETSVAAGKFIGLPAFPGPDRHIDVDVADHHLPRSSARSADEAIEGQRARFLRGRRGLAPTPREIFMSGFATAGNRVLMRLLSTALDLVRQTL